MKQYLTAPLCAQSLAALLMALRSVLIWESVNLMEPINSSVSTIPPSNFYGGIGSLINLKGNGGKAGGIGGINAQWNKVFQRNWLLGAEIRGELASLKSDVKNEPTSDPIPDAFGVANQVALNVRAHSKMDYSYGLLAKAGIVVKSCSLLYVCAGWMRSHWKLRAGQDLTNFGTISNFRLIPTSINKKKMLNGFRAGFGLGTMLTDNLMLNGEVGYTWNQKISATTRVTLPVFLFAMDRLDLHVSHRPRVFDARLYLSWKFNVCL